MGQGRGENLVRDVLLGFFRARALMAGYNLGVFAALQQPKSRDEAIAALDLPARSGRILLDALAASGVLEVEADKYRTPAELSELLAPADDAPFNTTRYLLDYYRDVFSAMGELEQLIRADGAGSTFMLRDYFKDDVNEVERKVAEEYSLYMEETSSALVDAACESFDFSTAKRVIDLCGCVGSFCRGLIAKHPHLEAAFLDVPACVDIAKSRFPDSPVQGVSADLFRDPLPTDFDVITMCRAAMDWGDEVMTGIYKRVHAALPNDGTFLIVERLLPETFDPAAAPLYLRSLYFLVKSETTLYRSASEHFEMLKQAGFSSFELVTPEGHDYKFTSAIRTIRATK